MRTTAPEFDSIMHLSAQYLPENINRFGIENYTETAAVVAPVRIWNQPLITLLICKTNIERHKLSLEILCNAETVSNSILLLFSVLPNWLQFMPGNVRQMLTASH